MPAKLKRKNKQIIDSDQEEENQENLKDNKNKMEEENDDNQWEEYEESEEEIEQKQQQQKKKLQKNKKKNQKQNKKNEDLEDDNDSENDQVENDALYKLLNVGKKATKDEIKKSYKKMALQLHPDKNPDPEAKEQFHKVKEAYQILIDDEKRALYDKTGKIGDKADLEAFQTAYDYFRELYKQIEQEDIIEFEKKYRHSEEEEKDLIQYYNDYKGNITLILETIMLSRNEDLKRYFKFYDEQIKNGNITKYAAYEKSKKNIKMLKDESSEADQALNDLAQQIMLRQNTRADDLFAKLEEKYCTKKTQKKKNDTKNTKKKIKK